MGLLDRAWQHSGPDEEEEVKVSCRGQRNLIEINENVGDDDGEILASLDAE